MGLTDWLKGPTCCQCGTKENLNNKDVGGAAGYTMEWLYCDKCYKEKQDAMAKRINEISEAREKQRLEDERDKYHKWLKREVEIIELEKRASEYGLNARVKYNGQL